MQQQALPNSRQKARGDALPTGSPCDSILSSYQRAAFVIFSTALPISIIQSIWPCQ